MGIFDKIKGELIDVIEWTDDNTETMVWRFPRHNNEIKQGAKLTVRESQSAVFVNEGNVADVFSPGMYDLYTQNLPVLSTLKGWKHGFESPYKAEVYFVAMRNFTDRKWGTKNPIMLRDPEFGPVRLRAFGSYALKVGDPYKFIKEIAGTDGRFESSEITDQLRNLIITRFTDALGESKIPILDLAANYDELSDFIQKKINPEFQELGVEITKFLVENISLPKNVEEALDKRSSMGIIGDLNKYTQYQTANSIEKAAGTPGGGMGQGMGMGMGFAMANQMAQSFGQPQQQQSNQQQGPAGPPPVPPQSQFYLAIDGKQQGPYDQAAMQKMAQDGTLTRETLIWKQGMDGWKAAGEADETKGLFGAAPPPLPPQ